MTKPLILKSSLGLDVSKDTVAACMAQKSTKQAFRILATRTFENNLKGFKAMMIWMKRFAVVEQEVHALMEATGVYYEALAYFLHEHGYTVSVVLPSKSKAYARSLDYKTKTDKIDSKILAQMSLERDLAEWAPQGKYMQHIKRLCRERVELMQQKTAAMNREHAKKHAHETEKAAIKRAKALIQFLKKQIQEVEEAIENTVKSDAEIKERVDKVCTIKGVGIITAACVIAETNGFALFKKKGQLVNYAGYDVVSEQSGSSIHTQGRISKRGNAFIRRALHYPALTAVKFEPELKALYDRVFERTRIPMKAYVAVQRKLLVLIYTLYTKNEAYTPNYQTKINLLKNRQEHLSVPA